MAKVKAQTPVTAVEALWKQILALPPSARAVETTALLALFAERIVPEARAARCKDFRHLRDEGWSLSAMAELTGLTSTRVMQLLHNQKMTGKNSRRYINGDDS